MLGPINVSRFVRNPFGANGPPGFDFSELGRRVRIQVRLLDNVLDLTRWPLPEQAAEAQAKRRIGVGLSGLGDALLMLRLDYGSPAARVFAARIARCIRDQAYLASAGLAAERGVFPAYAPRPYLEPRAGWPPLPPAVQAAIRRHGLRNSHLVSFAPTGSVSIAFFDNCSTGIEPAHAWQYRRRLRIGEAPPRNVVAQNPAWRLWRRLHGDGDELPPYFRRAADIAPSAHIAMLAALQPLGGCRDFEDGAAAARVHGGRGRRAVPASLAPGSERSDGVPAGSPDAGGAGAGPARRADRPGGSRGRLRGCRVTRWRAALRRQRTGRRATRPRLACAQKDGRRSGRRLAERRPSPALRSNRRAALSPVDPPACRSTG